MRTTEPQPHYVSDIIDDRPHDNDAERMILGVLLKMGDEYPAMIAEMVAELSAEDFYRQPHRQIWKAIQRLYAAGDTVDFLTVTRSIQQSNEPADIAYISGLLDGVPFYSRASALAPHVAILKSTATKRQLQALGNWLMVESNATDLQIDDLIYEAQSKLNGVSLLRETADNLISANEAVTRTMAELEQRWATPNALVGLTTGLPDLDRLIGGIRPGGYYCIAAGTGMGKTTLALNIVNSILADGARKDRPVAGLMISLEMTCSELIVKLIGINSMIDTSRIQSGQMTADQKAAFLRASQEIGQHHLDFVEGFGKVTPQSLAAMVERVKLKYGRIDFLCIDYVQLVDGDKKALDTEYARTSEVSRELKRLALQHNMPVIVLSQLNRQSTQRSNQDYTLSDIRSTGQIAQDSDVVLFLMPEDWANKDDMRRRLHIAKNRSGRSEVTIPLIFFPEQSRFAVIEESYR